jgi:hypothetical protein
MRAGEECVMSTATDSFEIDDARSFDANLVAFVESLIRDDPTLAEVLRSELPKLLRGEVDTAALWDALNTAAAGSASS